MSDAERPAARPPLWLALTRVARGAAVIAFVAFNLVVLAIRNPLDLWDSEIRELLREFPRWGGAAAADPDAEAPRSYWADPVFQERYRKADRFTRRFTNTAGFEQDWRMFRPPMSTYVYFLAVRLEFTDDTQVTVLSDNEPNDPTSYFRLGGWQERKLENQLLNVNADVLRDEKERLLYEAFARHTARRWRAANPNDPRELKSVVFVRRTIHFPKPGQTFEDVGEPTEGDLASFDPQGTNGRALR